MLPHYSPYKIAEVVLPAGQPVTRGASTWASGSAPGADMSTAVALATDGRPQIRAVPGTGRAQLSDLPVGGRTPSPVVSPRATCERFPLWMLGSSHGQRGAGSPAGACPTTWGLFINPQADPSPDRTLQAALPGYASDMQEKPYAILAMSVFCADSEEQARSPAAIHLRPEPVPLLHRTVRRLDP